MTKHASFRRSWIPWLGILVLALSATAPAAIGAVPPHPGPDALDGLQARPGRSSFLVFLNLQADLSAAEALPGWLRAIAPRRSTTWKRRPPWTPRRAMPTWC